MLHSRFLTSALCLLLRHILIEDHVAADVVVVGLSRILGSLKYRSSGLNTVKRYQKWMNFVGDRFTKSLSFDNRWVQTNLVVTHHKTYQIPNLIDVDL